MTMRAAILPLASRCRLYHLRDAMVPKTYLASDGERVDGNLVVTGIRLLHPCHKPDRRQAG